MKELSGLLVALLLATSALAQSQQSETIRFGIKAGANSTYASTQSFSRQNKSDKIWNGQGGVFANIPIASGFYVQPSLLYEGKGGNNTKATISGNVLLSYIELPVDILYYPRLGHNDPLFVGIGPYIAYAVSGRIKGQAGSSYNYDMFKDNAMPNTPRLFNRPDAGLNAQVGYQVTRHFQLSVNTDIGLVNILHYKNSGDYFRNVGFGAFLGYVL